MQRLFGILISWTLILLVVAGAGELAARAFGRVSAAGTSTGALTPHRFGPSHGNTPDFSGTSSGVSFTTDERGFRIDPEIQDPIGAPALLILGDEVAFGAGTPEAETMAGRLRRARTDRRIYNASSIGYTAADYAEVGLRLLPAIQPTDIFVVVSIDDVAERETDPVVPAPAGGLSRSQLYLLAARTLRDTARTRFERDRALYDQPPAAIAAALAPLVRLHEVATRAGARLSVLVMPEEPQLRGASPDLAPQRAIVGYLRGRQVPVEEAHARFANAGGAAADRFLDGDAKLLSATGHDVAFRMISAR